MREVRIDPTTGDEVVIATDRVVRPQHLRMDRVAVESGAECPFCPGAEHLTPPTLDEVRRHGEWVVRAFPNRFPALGIEGELERRARGPYERISGIGAHEVVVETRAHDAQPWAVDHAHFDALSLVRARLRDLSGDQRFRQLAWFRNHGAIAGASLPHPHSQLIALPVVPATHRRMVERFQRHLHQSERELMQDLVDHDRDEEVRWLWEDQGVAAICPWAPRVAFEVWVVPTRPSPRFVDADDATLRATARLLDRVLASLATALETPPYNLYLYTAPQNPNHAAGFRWHIRIFPRTAQLAGFELGSGGVLHGVPPEHAARVIRAAAG